MSNASDSLDIFFTSSNRLNKNTNNPWKENFQYLLVCMHTLYNMEKLENLI